jgi:hypothetical protein
VCTASATTGLLLLLLLLLFLLCSAPVQAMLFWVQCVNKGALVCRNNAQDDLAVPPRCLIVVRVPAQGAAEKGQLPPCTVHRGMR